MPEDGLAISTKAGEGAAVIFDKHNKDVSDFLYRDMEDRKQLLKDRQKEQEKSQAAKLKDLDELSKTNLNGVVKDRDYLLNYKNELQQKAAEYLVKTKGNGDISQNFFKEIAELGNYNGIAKQVQDYSDKFDQNVLQMHDKINPETIKAKNDFMKLSLPEKADYIKTHGDMPQLDLESKHYNFIDEIDKITPELVEVPLKEGNSRYYRDPKQVDERAARFVDAGLRSDNSTPQATAFMTSEQVKLEDTDPNFKYLSPDEKRIKLRESALESVKKIMYSKGGERTTQVPQKSEGKVDTSKNVSVTYDVTPDGTHIVNFSKNDVNENKPLDFIDGNGKPIKAVPIKFEEKPGHNPVLIVVEDVKRPSEDDPTKMVTTQVERRIPYNEASPKIKNEYGFTFEDIKQKGTVPKNVKVNDYSNKVKKSIAPHGEEVQTKEGLAVWDGKKYVLKK